MVGYFWFDPSTKDFKERGRLVRLSEPIPSWDYYFYRPDHKGPKAQVGFTETVTNVGARPIRQLDVVVGSKASAQQMVEVDGGNRRFERAREGQDFTVFTLVGALAPGDPVTITYRGQSGAMVTLLTEHGDRIEIMSQGKSAADPMPTTHSTTNYTSAAKESEKGASAPTPPPALAQPASRAHPTSSP